MNVFVFDIETIPDVQAGRRLYQLENLSDTEVAKVLQLKHGNQEFLPHYLHRIISISILLNTPQQLKIWSLGEDNETEKNLIQRFFQGIEKYSPTLVSWNGSAFDLPVLHYRALLNGVVATHYWESGENDAAFRWNNYLNRYHARHIDLLDVLSGYQSRAFAPLDAIATLIGCPGKMGMHGSQVWPYYLEGKLNLIRDYCETDVLNTYLVFLRFEYMRGHLDESTYLAHAEKLRAFLTAAHDKAHFQAFLRGWDFNSLYAAN